MKRNICTQLTIAFLITFMGGFCDGYTLLCRGGMFSYMQTGNLIRFCIALANGSFEYGFLIPILCFCLGCILSIFIKKYKYYTHVTLISLIAAFIGCGFCPIDHGWNIAVVSILSFVGAMQFQVFNKCLNINYTSTMCTNNIRLFSSNIAHKNFKMALFYFAVILSFAIGVVISVFITKAMNAYAIAPSASIFLIILIILLVTKNELTVIEE